MKEQHSPILALGVALGDPYSANTYSGVPYHLFGEMERRGELSGRINGNCRKLIDVFSGVIDVRKSIIDCRPRINKYWRFLPENIDRASIRLRQKQEKIPDHNAVIQIGVGGIPSPDKTFLAHAEISIETAATLPGFAETYGFKHGRKHLLERAMEGEKKFLESCDVIWTNSLWTAKTFQWAGIPNEKFWVHAPACNCEDPGPIVRDWKIPHILFVGKDWARKGGELVLSAFRELRREYPRARLTIIGCTPSIVEKGVLVLGYLDKTKSKSRKIIETAFKEATIFCMPSQWESTGLVYMEAASYGLPIIMLSGQGRENIFPERMAVHIKGDDRNNLPDILIALLREPEMLQEMGSFGANHIRENYSLGVVASRLACRIAKASS